MTVNIEKAEEIVDLCLSANNKKNLCAQKKLLHQVIEEVQEKRRRIKEFQLTVNIVSKQYYRKKQSLEEFIHQLNHREQSLDEGLAKIISQKKELERRQMHIEQDLQSMRVTAEKSREKKMRCERQYSSVISVPILSAQSKKKYIKARDEYSEAEQQVSEIRQVLDKCRDHLKLLSKTVSAQYSEQDLVHNQRRGSVDTIQSSTQQLEYLTQGRDFWAGFDVYQAKVVLESAIYLAETECPPAASKKKTTMEKELDINQVWQKTFKLACFEYGDREMYGDTRWSMTSLEINFDCDMCQTSQTGWPKVVNDSELACELCYSTIPQQETRKHSITIIEPSIKSLKESKIDLTYPALHHNKMKKVFSTLFNYHPRVDPL